MGYWLLAHEDKSGSAIKLNCWCIVVSSFLEDILRSLPIAKVFVCKQWPGFEFDSVWQRSVELPFKAIERRKKFYFPTRRHQLCHQDLRYCYDSYNFLLRGMFRTVEIETMFLSLLALIQLWYA